MKDLEAKIAAIGREVVACQRSCEGVYSSPPDGVIPRGLLLELRNPSARGVIFLGMNPGKGDDCERARFRVDASYESTVRFMRECRLPKHQYYLRLRALVDACRLGGHQLWTERAKCQCDSGSNNALSFAYETCGALFLRREIEAVPRDWVVFAVGKVAYRFAQGSFFDRAVVGVYHPTGSWPKYWSAMFDGDVLLPEFRLAVAGIVKERRAAWLGDEVRKGDAPR